MKLPSDECHWTPLENSTLVQVMAWCHQATSHYLSQCWHVDKPMLIWVEIMVLTWLGDKPSDKSIKTLCTTAYILHLAEICVSLDRKPSPYFACFAILIVDGGWILYITSGHLVHIRRLSNLNLKKWRLSNWKLWIIMMPNLLLLAALQVVIMATFSAISDDEKQTGIVTTKIQLKICRYE